MLNRLALWLCLCASASAIAAADRPFKGCEVHLRFGIPRHIEAPTHKSAPLCRLGYAASHNPERKVPDWVAWHLSAPKATACAVRNDAFRADPQWPKGSRAELSDYLKSGYDRGHLAPNADFNWSAQAARESFYLSNMAPQLHGLNGGIWKTLEEATRVWATERGELYIIAGPLFEGDRGAIGKNKVAVPSHFYKIIYDPEAREALAFIFPHGQIKGKNFGVFHYTVREVEERTGLNFLTRLPGTAEDAVETVRPELWEYDAGAWRKMMKAKCAGG